MKRGYKYKVTITLDNHGTMTQDVKYHLLDSYPRVLFSKPMQYINQIIYIASHYIFSNGQCKLKRSNHNFL